MFHDMRLSFSPYSYIIKYKYNMYIKIVKWFKVIRKGSKQKIWKIIDEIG